MGELENRDVLALSGVLVNYSGDSESLTVPKRLNGHPITAVGRGAASECASLKRLVIPGEIRRLGGYAFSLCPQLEEVVIAGDLPTMDFGVFQNCPRLKTISLLRFPLSEEAYRQLRENSCRLEDGSLAAERFPDGLGLDWVKNCIDAKPFWHVPKTAGVVFQDESAAPRLSAEESARFLRLIRKQEETPSLPETEEENDLRMRRENVPAPQATALFCVDGNNAVREGKGWMLRAQIRIGRFFWQSKVRIAWDGQIYYLCQRNYLTSDAKMEYVRKNIAVFSGDGPLRNERKAAEIYAKYQLSSIL